MSRKIEDLTPEMQSLYHLFKNKMDESGLSFIVTTTYRPQLKQDALYSQGRATLDIVNMMRKKANLAPITKDQNFKVTWTRKSRHTDREAFDIAILKDGKITWNPANYLEAVKIGKSVGLDAGGAWTKNKDYTHFEKAKEAK